MRRLVLSISVAFGLVMIGAGSASAEPVPTGSAKATAGKKVCRVTDRNLDELSGLVATKSGFISMNDSSLRESSRRVFFLSNTCKVTKEVAYSGDGPRDTEDMVLSVDGKTVWIADIGDNNKERKTIGLWKMPVDGSRSPQLYRLAYPAGDGPYDAEALLLNGDGTPIIVTKALDSARVYVPTGPLKASSATGVPMRRVGTVTVPPSTTPTGLPFGRGVITGGAVAPDGSRVVLRTYSDALEWDVTGGDVLAALKGRPRVTPLPNEQQGEAITYSPDGGSFFTVSDMQGIVDEDNPNYILRYTPVTAAAAQQATSTALAAGRSPASAKQSWFDQLSLSDITRLVGGVGVLGALLVAAGVFGILRSRRRAAGLDPAGESSVGGRDVEPATDPAQDDPVRGRPVPAGAGVYGGTSRAATLPSSAVAGVYGAPAATPPAPPKGGGVYGGPNPANRPQPGGVYGAQPPRTSNGAGPTGPGPNGAGPHGAGPHGAGPHGAGPHGAGPNGAGRGGPQGGGRGPAGAPVPQGAPGAGAVPVVRGAGAPQGPPVRSGGGRPPAATSPGARPPATPPGRPRSGPPGQPPAGPPTGRPQGAAQGPGSQAPMPHRQGPPPARPAGASAGRPSGPAQHPPTRQHPPARQNPPGRRPNGPPPAGGGPAPQGGAGARPPVPPSGQPRTQGAGKPRPAAGPSGRPSGFFGRDSTGQDPGRREPGRPDSGRPEAGRSDAGRSDAGRSDAGRSEGGRPKAGGQQAGRGQPGRPGPAGNGYGTERDDAGRGGQHDQPGYGGRTPRG